MKTLFIYIISIFFLSFNTSHADDLEELIAKYHTAINIESLFYTIVNTKEIKVIKDEVISESAESKTRHIILETPGILNLGKIELKKRDPKTNLTNTEFPTAVILSGTNLGMSVINYVLEVPDYSIVTIHHNIDFEVTNLTEALELIEDIWKLQAHYIVIYSWLQQQSDVNPYLISSVNISFGTYMAPLPLRILKAIDITPHTTVFAFGGSELMPFVDEYLKDHENDDTKNNIKKIVRPILDLFESDDYLPYLEGPFLVINATEDKVIPIESNNSLITRLRESGGEVDVFNLDGPHVNIDQPRMIEKSVVTIFDWINRQPIKTPFKEK